MGKTERPTIIGQVDLNRSKEKDRKDSVAAAQPAIRSSRAIIDRLMEGRQLHQDLDFPRPPALILNVGRDKGSITVNIQRTFPHGGIPVYEIFIQDLDRVAKLYSDYGFIRKAGSGEGRDGRYEREGLKLDGTETKSKRIGFDTANRYLHFLDTIEDGIRLGGVKIENPLIRPQTEVLPR